MKLRRYKTLAVSGLVIAATALTSATALAADVNINAPSADVQQKVVLEKTEAVVPSFAVDIPATVELAATAQDLKYTLTLENDEAFIPDGKKVSVTIESAGYPGTLNKFAVWDSKNLNEASYEIYYSDRMVRRPLQHRRRNCRLDRQQPRHPDPPHRSTELQLRGAGHL